MSPHTELRVVLVAEQGLFRAGLRSLLESASEFCKVEEAGSGLDIALRTALIATDLLILDLAVPVFPTPEVLQALAATVPIVVLWDDRDRPNHQVLRESGVWRSIDKRLGAAALFDAVRDAIGRRPNVATISNVRQYGLTPRERQVLAGVASAFPNRQIAQQLAITEDTVKRHLTSIFDKVGVSNRVELTLFAVHHRLLDTSMAAEKPRPPFRSSRTPRRILPWRPPLIGIR